jgi:hypothetical protein
MNIDYEPEGDEEQGKSLNLCIWDFCGHPFYRYPHYLFFEQPSLAILTFDMKAYSPDKFDDVIASWFDWMLAKTNKIVTILVGTHVIIVLGTFKCSNEYCNLDSTTKCSERALDNFIPGLRKACTLPLIN